jgi:rare lipoprotein A (peptidoglycan hydrolase)
MSGRRSPEVIVTKTLPFGLRAKVQQYLSPLVILSVALWSSLTTHAHACPDWNGQTGVASWYGPGFQGGRTLSGERFDMSAMTAAHPCLPMGTKILVTVLGSGRNLIVTVNDRMPSRRRILDLSAGAARALGIVGQGVAVVRLSPASAGMLAAR